MQHASDNILDEHGGHGGHPSTLFYNIIAVALFVITAIEVAILYPPLDQAGTYLKVITLVVLSLGKFCVVVAFFMHLFFDAPLLTFLFAMGMVIGVGTVVALIHVIPPPEHPLQPRPKEKVHEAKADHAFLDRMDRWRRNPLG